MIAQILSRNLSWQDAGFSFNDILKIRDEIIEEDPFCNVGTNEIQERLGINYMSELDSSDLKRMNYLIIDDRNFDGDLSFVHQFSELEYLKICGISSRSKIKDIEPLRGLSKLKFMDLSNNEISDLSPLSYLHSLEEIYLFQNPYQSIEPIVELKNLKKISIYCENELHLHTLLRNSPSCVVQYCNRVVNDCYTLDSSILNQIRSN